MSNNLTTKRQFRSWLGDDIGWKTLYAIQHKLYESREAALIDAIRFCSGISEANLISLILDERDRLILANALSLCPVAELGDRVGGNDDQTAKRLVELASMFDQEIANNIAALILAATKRNRNPVGGV